MPSMHVGLNESDVIRLILEFFESRLLDISLLALERETGIVNGLYSDDALFLRQLILDGQWEDVIEFIQPLATIPQFNVKMVEYIIYKHQYLELLCIKAEFSGQQSQGSDTDGLPVDEIVRIMHTLEQICPSKEEYNHLCLLLTLSSITEHPDYRNWNPSSGRVLCFKEIFPLVERFLPVERQSTTQTSSGNDRLIQLLIKGILYESCVDYCQQKAAPTEMGPIKIQLPMLLEPSTLSDTDLSLLSWLQSIPDDAYACPFEQMALKVHLNRLNKPTLEASWTEQILATPVKPKLFPYSAVPTTRSRAAEVMSRSLNPQLDGLVVENKRASSSVSSGDDNLSRSHGVFHSPTTVANHTDAEPKRNEIEDSLGSDRAVEKTRVPREKARSLDGSRTAPGNEPSISNSSDGGLFREYQKLKQKDDSSEPVIVGQPGRSPRQTTPVGPIPQHHTEPIQEIIEENNRHTNAVDMDSVRFGSDGKQRFVPITTLEGNIVQCFK